MKLWPVGLSLVFLSFAACNGDGDELDAGPADTGDAGVDTGVVPDTGTPDTGTVDTGANDVGFADPNTIQEGVTNINMARVYVHLRGTLTSTMPPLVLLGTGPHSGGVPGFFRSFGGGIGVEYLPEHMDFLLEGRTMLYFDMRGLGRSGFGTIGSSTITVPAHVNHLAEMVDWLDDIDGVDASEVDLFGHGYGAGVAALYAADNPARVSRMVLASPMPPTVSQLSLSIQEIQARLTTADRQRLDILTREPECRGNLSLCTVEVFYIYAPRMMCDQNYDLINDLDFRHADVRTYDFLNMYLVNSRYDWSTDFGRITAPTTIVSGDCDTIPLESAVVYSSSISGSVHVPLSDSGHFPMVESPTAFQRVVKEALTYP